MTRGSRAWHLLLCAAMLAGCYEGERFHFPRPADTGAAPVLPPEIPADVFVTLKAPAEAHQALCDNDGMHPRFPDDADRITKVFCQDLKPGGVVPAVRGLADLQRALDLDFKDPNGGNGTGGNPAFALLAHSSALTARKVTTITPTAFVFTPPPPGGAKPSGYVFLAFDPGEQFVEIASHDPTTDALNFYLVVFDHACAAAPGGCTPTQLLTPAITTGWSNVRVYEMSTELDNTIADCHVCHDPKNTGNAILRMQEIKPPFTHWFSKETRGGQALLADFHSAHGNAEDYGPVPASLLDQSSPAQMAAMIAQAGFADQPNAFDSEQIEAEVQTSSAMQPAQNLPMGASPTWQAIYERAVAGEQIATPYHDVKITDASKLDAATKAYRQWMAGALPALPDISAIFLDAGLADMGFAARPGQGGRGLLAQMCQECHNADLDPMVSRDLFLVDKLAQQSRAEKDEAIRRLQLPTSTRLTMPPPLFRTVTDAERALMIDELRK